MGGAARWGGWLLGWVMLGSLGLAPLPVAAQVCCPAGCVQNGAACVRTGPTPTACARVDCAPRGPAPGGATSGGGARGSPGVVYPHRPTRSRVCKLDGQLPPGSFSRTCPQVNYQCNWEQDKLSAVCKSRNGQLKKSALVGASTCANVENIDGKLVCRKWRRYVAD